MPRDAAGTYSRTNGAFSGSTTWAQQAASADKVINSGRHDTHDNDLGQALTDSLDRTGKGSMLAPLDMNSNKVTNVTAGTNAGDAATIGGTETLTNKTLTSPTLNTPIITGGFWNPIERQVASDDATIEFSSLDPTNYESYRVHGFGIRPAIDAQTMYLRVGTGGGPTYQAGASDYHVVGGFSDPSTSNYVGVGGLTLRDSIIVYGATQGAGNLADENGRFDIGFSLADNGTLDQIFDINATYVQSGGFSVPYRGSGKYMSATAITGIQFLFSSGNIAEGVFVLEGLRK